MVRELTSELRRFEGQASDFNHVEVLAWTISARKNKARVEIGLLWGRTGTATAPTGWALAQAYRHPEGGGLWHRSLFNRYLSSPLIHQRPGEDADGTWHGFQRYAHPPTSREVCEFAEVDLAGQPPVPYRRLSGAVRTQAWLRAVGEQPVCDLGMR